MCQGEGAEKKNKKAKGCSRKKAFCKEDSTIFLVSCGTKVRHGPYIFLEEVYSLLKTNVEILTCILLVFWIY